VGGESQKTTNKGQNEYQNSIEEGEKIYNKFFEKPTRKPIEKENEESLLNYCISCLKENFRKYSNPLFLDLQKPEDHMFYQIMLKDFTDNLLNTTTNSNEAINNKQIKDTEKQQTSQQTIEEIFLTYLREFYQKSNPDYFNFMFKFILLFHEGMKVLRDDPDFSKGTIEQVPDMCNSFFEKFMEPNDYFGLDTNELIDIVQHFCYWLYKKNHTTSRLTLAQD
jgi:hypothetical protein